VAVNISIISITKAITEITTMDNDKTDLSVPLKYQFDIVEKNK
jgi:predicted rRNA methylase YqxC with S4 and FtsJ domains